jgi:heme-degrading monooxygenase HmoA
MFLALWEFEVKSGYEERFQAVYGADGEWVRLFRKAAQFVETRLLRDISAPRKFVTVDFWRTRSAYEAFKELNSTAYLELDRECESFTVSERCWGCFEDEVEAVSKESAD